MSVSIYDVVIIGAGAAGLMCAAFAGKRGRKVLVIDHAKKPAEKIRISGGGRCNFTNIHANPNAYLSQNPHFCKSAFSQFTPQDFIAMVERHGIAYHEKKAGQLFCDNSAQDIIDMLLQECTENGVEIQLGVTVEQIGGNGSPFTVFTSAGHMQCSSLVIATGGLSIPKMGATPFGYRIAEQYGHAIVPPRAGLVPLTFQNDVLDMCKDLTGVSLDACVVCGKTEFTEGLLFTHRGLSGPSILQISSYWREGLDITVNMAPHHDVFKELKQRKSTEPKQDIVTALSAFVPKRLAAAVAQRHGISGKLAEMSDAKLQSLADNLNAWKLKPNGTEGYRTAEVTIGGVSTDGISSKTMESKHADGLYFIGEVVDVTGWLGGYNFQWAWSSAYVAAQNV